MKKTLAALFLLLPSLAAAYSHSLINKTQGPISVWVNYAGCGNDGWTVQPGQTITWRSGGCCISSVNADTVVDNRNRDRITRKYASACRNTNWTVTGGYWKAPANAPRPPMGGVVMPYGWQPLVID